MKVRNVNIKSIHTVDIERAGVGKYKLSFTGYHPTKDEHVRYNFMLDQWDLESIAEKLWKPVKWMRKQISDLTASLIHEPVDQ